MKMLFTLLYSLGLATTASISTVKDYSLINQEGKPFQLYDLKGKYLMITFIYSHCPVPSMCPLTITLSNRLIRKWKANKTLKEKYSLQVLAVTLDPEKDTPKVLKKFGESHAINFSHFTLATGDPKTLSDFAAEFNVVGFPSQGTISHNIKNILLDPKMKVIKEYKENGWQPEEVLKEIHKMEGKEG